MHNSNTNYNTAEYTVIYIYSIPKLDSHRGDLKIGKTSIKLSVYGLASDKQKAIDDAAHKRVSGDLKTSEIRYKLEDACLAIKSNGETFMDHDVHSVLKRSGIPNIVHVENKTHGEWFKVNLETAINAINAVKAGRASLDPRDIVSDSRSISFRKGSQTEAITETIDAINKGKAHFLWDAKMRFGKTLTALEVAKKMNYGKVLIVTHRPEVSDDWYTDFKVLFRETDYQFGSGDKGERFSRLQSQYLKGANGQQANPFVYFASIQYLRHEVKSAEKTAILNEVWDMLIIDEADEGVKTTLSNETIKPIKRDFTLMLSGTPFNLLEDYKEDEIYSWDYTKEQELKAHWEDLYPDEPNPYYKLPKLSIFVYDLNKYIPDSQYKDLTDKAFNFKEFFRVDTDGEFIHEKDVLRFLDLITSDGVNNFPFSTQEYRQNLRHTLWMVPGVKEARALEKMLHKHPVFTHFNIANVAGDGNEEIAEKKSRNLVKKAITDDPLSAYSITISCGKMTRGVSVPEWTAVFMLSNTSSASTYLQTIFRGQTPWEHQGLLKTECFVFDFAPDRTLTVVAEVMNIKKKRPTTEEVKEATGKFLNYCSVISATHGEMKPFSAQKLLHAIKKVAIQKVTRNGFDDNRLYNIENLDKCSDEDLQDFAILNAIVGTSKGEKESNKIKMADNGFTEEEREKAEKAKKKKKERIPLTPEEEELLRRKKEIADQRKTRMSILRGVSIRMPMLIFGCKIDKNGNEIKPDDEITLKQFIENVDDESWKEFMPDGVTKEMLSEKFAKFYDDEVFIGAGIDIRLRALAADMLAPSERVVEIAEVFKGFKNPDKETVLTPWRVVNMHISSTLGGSDFNDMVEFDQDNPQAISKLGLPNWVDQGEVSNIWDERTARVLEINSKSGLYPLLCAYNFYTRALPSVLKHRNSEEEVFRGLWNEILANNIYVVCKSPMAKTIAERTLAGYTNTRTNIVYVKDFIDKLRAKKPYETYNIAKDLSDKFNLGEDVKFDAVVGNPPYQDGNDQVYASFAKSSIELSDLVSLIFPTGWQKPTGVNGLSAINTKEFKHSGHIVKVDNYYENNTSPVKLFSGVSTGGVNIFLWNRHYANAEGLTPIYEYGEFIKNVKLPITKEDMEKPLEIKSAWSKVGPLNTSMADKGSARKPYGFEADPLSDPSKYGLTLTDSKQKDDDLRLFGLIRRVRNYKYIARNQALKLSLLTDEWKLFIPKAWGNMDEKTGYLGGSYGSIFVGEPGDICSETYIEFGPFVDRNEAESAEKYFKTKFFRAVFYMSKVSQNTARDTFRTVPVQNFTPASDIDWSRSIPEIDQQLYKKYGLSQKEIDFIETKVKAME